MTQTLLEPSLTDRDDDDERMHIVCDYCYPPDTSDYVISLCGQAFDLADAAPAHRWNENLCPACADIEQLHKGTHGV